MYKNFGNVSESQITLGSALRETLNVHSQWTPDPPVNLFTSHWGLLTIADRFQGYPFSARGTEDERESCPKKRAASR